MFIFPGARWEPVPSHSGPMSEHLGPIEHVQVGNGDCYGEFDNPGNQASSTLWFPKVGTHVQYVDGDLIAWTQAAGNDSYNGWEFEGYPNEPLNQNQILNAARCYVAGHAQYGWPLVLAEAPGQPGFGWHGMGGAAWGGHYDCPGDVRKPQRLAILYIASLVINPPAPAPAPTTEDLMFVATDQASGKLIGTDANGDFYGDSYNPPIVQVGLNQHPEWKAGEAESAGQNPCIGIVSEKDADGTWGYTYITAPTSGKGGWGPYNRYHINRNGTF